MSCAHLPPCKADPSFNFWECSSCSSFHDTDLMDQYLNDERDCAHPHAQAEEPEGDCELMKCKRGLNILNQ